MIYKWRSDSLFFYRVFFIALLLLVGIAGTGIVAVEHYTDIEIINASTERDKQAITATSAVMGTFSLLSGILMLYLMRERRIASKDRRQNLQPLEFPDRRSKIDRRNT